MMTDNNIKMLPADFTSRVMNAISIEKVKRERRKTARIIVMYSLIFIFVCSATLYALSYFKILSFSNIINEIGKTISAIFLSFADILTIFSSNHIFTIILVSFIILIAAGEIMQHRMERKQTSNL